MQTRSARKAGSLILLLAAGLLLGTGTAQPGGASVPVELSLGQAVEAGIAGSTRLERAEITLEKAWLGEKVARDMAEKLTSAENFTILSYDELAARELGPLQAEATTAMAQKQYDLIHDQVAMEVEKQYYDVLKSTSREKIKNDAVSRSEEQLRQVQARIKAGAAARADSLKVETQLAKDRAGLATARNKLEQAFLILNSSLELPAGARPKLTAQVTYEPLGDVEVEEAVAQALEKRAEVWLAEQNKALAEDKLKLTGLYFLHPNKQKEIELAVREADLELREVRSNAALLVRTTYLDILTAEENYKLLQQGIDSAREALRLARLTYDAGLSTIDQVLNAQVSLAEAEAALLEITYDHLLAKGQWRLVLGSK